MEKVYIVYLNKSENLDKYMLFVQIDKLVERVKNTFYTSYTQKKLDKNLRTIRLARNLFSTKLLNRDLRYVEKYRSEFNSKKLTRFIKAEGRRLKLDLPIPEDLDLIEKTLPEVEDFYYYAGRRNDVLAGNSLASMNSEGDNIGILVTGGFGGRHYPEAEEITYVPRIKTPVLMLNGRYDMSFILEKQVKPFFDLLGTPQEDKLLRIYETDHYVPANEMIKETLNWLDTYFGPVERKTASELQ